MQEQDKDLLALKALAHDAKFSGTATAQGVLALWRYIEQQAARIEELERIARNATGYVKELESASSPAVDLSGLTLSDADYRCVAESHGVSVETVKAIFDEHAAFIERLSSAPVVREGKMTEKRIMQIGLTFDLPAFRAADYRASGGSGMTVPEQEDYDAQIGFARAIEREVLATGKGAEPVACRYKGSGGEWVIGHIVDKEKAAAYGCEFLYTSPFATPSTPSQAWDGELPTISWGGFSPTIVDEDGLPQAVAAVLRSNGDIKDLANLYALIDAWGEKQRNFYARKAIGAAVAGVRDAADKLDARLHEISEIVRAGIKWNGNDYDFQPKSESDVAMIDDILTDALRMCCSLRSNPASVQREKEGGA